MSIDTFCPEAERSRLNKILEILLKTAQMVLRCGVGPNKHPAIPVSRFFSIMPLYFASSMLMGILM